MTSAVFAILGGLGLFIYGLRTLLRRFESFASSRIRPHIQRSFANPVASWSWGAIATLFSQSSNLSVISLMGLTEIGFISVRSGYFAMLGASAGTTVGLWALLSGWHLGPCLVAAGAFGLLVARTEYWDELMSALFSIGLSLMGLEILFGGVRSVFGELVQQTVMASSGSMNLTEQLPFFFQGTMLGFILQSASAPIFLLQSEIVEKVTLATGVALFLGANLGLTVIPLVLSLRSRALVQRLAWAHLITQGVGVVGALFLFPTFMWVVEKVARMLYAEPTLLAQLATAQLLFSLINSLIFGVLAEVVLRLLASWLPEKKIRGTGLAKRVRRMLFQDPDLAAQECNRQLRQLELGVKANYDQVMHRLTTTNLKDSFKERERRERNFRSLKFTIHDLLFAVDRHRRGKNSEGVVILTLIEYYGALTRTLFHLEDHYEKGLSKKFKFPPEMEKALVHYKTEMDHVWHKILLHDQAQERPEMEPCFLEETVLTLNEELGMEHQGFIGWLMEGAGYLRLINSDLEQLCERRSQIRSLIAE